MLFTLFFVSMRFDKGKNKKSCPTRHVARCQGNDGETISRLGFLSGVAGQFISIAVASVTGMILAAKW